MFHKTISRFFGCLVLSQIGQVDAVCDPYIYNPTSYSTSFSAKAEYLLLRCNETLPWVTTLHATATSAPNGAPFLKAKTTQLNMNWDSGFRIGLGVNLPCQWDLKVDWTTFQTQTRRRVNGSLATTGSSVFPAFSFTAPDLFPASDYRFTSSYNYNDVLLYLNRDFQINSCLTLSPRAGIKALFTRQINRFDFAFTTMGINLGTSSGTELFNSPHHFWSVGAFATLESFWELMWGLGIDADFGLSLLAGRHKVTIADTFIDFFAPNTVTVHRFNELDYTLDGSLSLVWSTPCNNNRGKIRLKAGCEGHYISDQTKFPDAANPVTLNSQPLTLLGFVFGVYVEL